MMPEPITRGDISGKLDYIIRRLDDLCVTVTEHGRRITDLERNGVRREERERLTAGAHADLEQDMELRVYRAFFSNLWKIGLAVVIAVLAGYFTGLLNL